MCFYYLSIKFFYFKIYTKGAISKLEEIIVVLREREKLEIQEISFCDTKQDEYCDECKSIHFSFTDKEIVEIVRALKMLSDLDPDSKNDVRNILYDKMNILY